MMIVLPNGAAVAQAAAQRLTGLLLELTTAHAPVHVVVTGGRDGLAVLGALRANPLLPAINWTDVHLWWSDERFVPPDHAQSNYGQARATLLDDLSIPAGNVHAMGGPDRFANVHEAAAAYAEDLTQVFRFDLVLLGLGPDGHIASLFPDQAGNQAVGAAAIGVENSPKPPRTRLSLTLPVLSAAQRVWFVASGKAKRLALARSVAGDPQVPAGRVHGQLETIWFADAAAAGV
ncbi:MAG: 6-phosphogluconolactonase [Bifidobacteriaceae bacterium]|jgi:6-phosphogluconolactonase|nr:6-phosphogluconolactonase [Bifidobacteriaceae bacterium]